MFSVAARPNLLNAGRQYANFLLRGYAQMSFTFASPGQVFFKDADVHQIDVPTQSGTIGILPRHVPLLATLSPGTVVVTTPDGNKKKFFVSSGSLTINEDSLVQVLAEEACAVEDLDANAIREGMSQASAELSSAKEEKAKAEAQIKLDVFDALAKAAEEKH